MSNEYSQMKPLESKNCFLRPVRLSDAKDLYECYSKDIVVKYLPIKKHSNIKDTERFIKKFFINNYNQGRVGHYAIVSKRDNKVIGNQGFNNIKPGDEEAEIGICINPNYWGDDYATEITEAMINYGFTHLNLKRIIAETYKENSNSTKSLKNLGFIYLETVTKNFSNTNKKTNINKLFKSILLNIKDTVCYRYILYKENYTRYNKYLF